MAVTLRPGGFPLWQDWEEVLWSGQSLCALLGLSDVRTPEGGITSLASLDAPGLFCTLFFFLG